MKGACRVQVIEKLLGELTPYENNPRNNDEAVPYVANSIREFGFKVPIVIDSDGVIIAGHTRYKAAHSLGMDTVPCIVADDLTPDQVRAFRIADNKVAEMAEWDENLLGLEISEVDLDMGDFGFDVVTDEDFGTDFELDDSDAPQGKTVSLFMTQEQFDYLTEAIEDVDRDSVVMAGGNENADKVCEVVRQWRELRI